VAGIKQYGVIVGLITAVLLAATNRAALARVVIAGAVTLALLLVPFLILDWQAFYASTVQQVFSVGTRLDALSLPVLWQHVTKTEFPSILMTLIYLATLGFCCWWVYTRGPQHLRHWAAGIAIMYGVLFLWGKLAFCNYYHLECFLVLNYLLLSLAAQLPAEPSSNAAAQPSTANPET
jgi:hypothetical protein